ncbi:MAG: class I SAM-dependent methyltransferase [Pseudomonadota bacterium]
MTETRPRAETPEPDAFVDENVLWARPEMRAGGYGRFDGDIEFYLRINALAKPHHTVLDFGAGRGSFVEDPCTMRRDLRALKGKVKHVVGCDIDPVILENTSVDESVLLKPDEMLPFEKSRFDIVICDWVVEHVENPAAFALDMSRIVKPGGWLCARTPNKWGLTGIGARIVPESMQDRLLQRLWPGRNDLDVFPKYYRLNTMAAIRRAFPERDWSHASYGYGGEPKYHGNSRFLLMVFAAWNAAAPAVLCTDLMVFMRKKSARPSG